MDIFGEEANEICGIGFVRVVDTMGNDDAIVAAARVSYGKMAKRSNPTDRRNLIRYLYRHRHTSPFEMCEIKLHVRCPIFVARQWVRHRTASMNEISGRYVELPTEFFVPPMAIKALDNKQGRGGDIPHTMFHDLATATCDSAFESYKSLLASGVAPEVARTCLPLSTFTEFVWKIDLHNLLHFLKLRVDPHAQKEIRDYADAIEAMVAKWVPDAHEAWCDYSRNAYTLSANEVKIFRSLIDTSSDFRVRLTMLVQDLVTNGTMSNREANEFLDKFYVSEKNPWQ